METSEYIYNEEKARYNREIIRYNGLINGIIIIELFLFIFFFIIFVVTLIQIIMLIDSNGSMTVYEFINSFRESNESPHPKITSQTTKNALIKLKEMKDKIGESNFNLNK